MSKKYGKSGRKKKQKGGKPYTGMPSLSSTTPSFSAPQKKRQLRFDEPETLDRINNCDSLAQVLSTLKDSYESIKSLDRRQREKHSYFFFHKVSPRVSAMSSLIAGASSHQIAYIMRFSGKLGAELKPDFTEAWADRFCETMPYMDKRQLMASLHGLREMRFYPAHPILSKITERFLEIQNGEPDTQLDCVELTRVFADHAEAGIVPDRELLMAWSQKCSEMQGMHDYYESRSLLRSLAIFDILRPDWGLRTFAGRVDEGLKKLNHPKDGQDHALMQARMYLDLPLNSIPSSYDTHDNKSRAEQRFRTLLEETTRINVEDGEFIPEIPRHCDMKQNYYGTPVHIEYDGAFHFSRDLSAPCNAGHDIYNGSTLLQSALMEKLRPTEHFLRVRAVDGNELQKLPQDRAKKSLKRIMDEVVQKPAGVYESKLFCGGFVGQHLPTR